MQRLLNKFNAIREQKVHETPTTPPEVAEERMLPTAIVPPVVQNQPKHTPAPYFHPMKSYPEIQHKWENDENQQQKNIISISVGQQQQQKQYHGYQGWFTILRSNMRAKTRRAEKYCLIFYSISIYKN